MNSRVGKRRLPVHQSTTTHLSKHSCCLLQDDIHSHSTMECNIHANITHSSLSVPPFVRLFSHSFTHSFIHSFIHSFTHSLIHSFIHPLHLFTHSLTHSFTHSFTHSLTHSSNTFIHSFVHSFVHSQCHRQRKEKQFLPSIAGYFSPSTDLTVL